MDMEVKKKKQKEGCHEKANLSNTLTDVRVSRTKYF